MKFSSVVSLEENKTKHHLERFLLLHSQRLELLPQDQDLSITEQVAMVSGPWSDRLDD